ncbi:MAG: ABC-type uncharacterized transport system permease subunit [Myxococcota bacterium]|jgi:ABC-type uncharacterized transport system permease subunit
MTRTLLLLSAAGFALAAALYLVRLVRFRLNPPVVAHGALAGATIALGAAFGLGIDPGATGAQALGMSPLVVMAVLIALSVVVLIAERMGDTPVAAPVVTAIAAVIVLGIFFKMLTGAPPAVEGALRSVTIVHISATITGFLLLTPAFVLSTLSLGQSYRLKTKQHTSSRLPSLVTMERTAWRLLYIGFPLYTLGIILGWIWQESAVAQGVQPQQVFAVVSWLIYAYAIYRRITSGWRGTRASVTLLAAFVLTLGAVVHYMLR